MIITLVAEPFLIYFNLSEVVKISLNESLYKFSITFKHYDNEKIKFSLPSGYTAYFNTSDLNRLILLLSHKMNELISQSDGKEVDINFDKNCFVNSEYDIEIRVDSGEYYPNEKEGLLHLLFFFNLNVAHNYEGLSMVGLQVKVELINLKNFVLNIENLVKQTTPILDI